MYLLEHLKEIYVQQQDYSKAISVQQKIINQNSLKEEDLVVLYIQNNETDKASNLISKLEEKGLLSSSVKMYYKGISKSESDEVKSENLENKSLEALKNSFKKDKDFLKLKQILQLELETNQTELLVKDSSEGLELFPAQPTMYLFNAIGLNKQLNYSKAIEALNNGIDFVIDNQTLLKQFYNEFAISYKGLKNEQKANEYKAKANN